MKTILHLGYPKVMSKFLQIDFFPKLKNVNYVNHYGSKYLLYHEIRKLIYNSSDKYFQNNVNSTRSKILKFIVSDKINLFSDEIYFWPNKIKYDNIIKRLKELFNFNNNELIILVFTRSQKSILRSMYSENQNLFQDLDKNYDNYNYVLEDFFAKENNNIEKINFFSCLDYNSVICKIKSDYNLKINSFSFESIINNDSEVLKNISLLFDENYLHIQKLLLQKPFHVTQKSENNRMMLIKNNQLVNFVRKLMFFDTIKSIFPLKIKFIIKNFMYKISPKKLDINEKLELYIDKFYSK